MKLKSSDPNDIDLKLFELGFNKKLILVLITVLLWLLAAIAYSIPNFNHWLLLSLNWLRADTLFATLCYYYTRYMLYAVGIPVAILYLASFKVNLLKPYRIVLLLSVMVLAIGIPIVDLIKYVAAEPRPWILYPDINSLYHGRGTSFPSGHAFQSFAGTLPLVICFLTNDGNFKRNSQKTVLAILLLIFAISLSFSRVFAGMHYISDLLFGIGLAIILMLILWIILQYLLNNDKLNRKNEKWYALVFIIMITIGIFIL
jgi:membrane-associated phospholipid phosphatase